MEIVLGRTDFEVVKRREDNPRDLIREKGRRKERL